MKFKTLLLSAALCAFATAVVPAQAREAGDPVAPAVVGVKHGAKKKATKHEKVVGKKAGKAKKAAAKKAAEKKSAEKKAAKKHGKGAKQAKQSNSAKVGKSARAAKHHLR